jgi:hypothetical protein
MAKDYHIIDGPQKKYNQIETNSISTNEYQKRASNRDK